MHWISPFRLLKDWGSWAGDQQGLSCCFFLPPGTLSNQWPRLFVLTFTSPMLLAHMLLPLPQLCSAHPFLPLPKTGRADREGVEGAEEERERARRVVLAAG